MEYFKFCQKRFAKLPFFYEHIKKSHPCPFCIPHRTLKCYNRNKQMDELRFDKWVKFPQSAWKHYWHLHGKLYD